MFLLLIAIAKGQTLEERLTDWSNMSCYFPYYFPTTEIFYYLNKVPFLQLAHINCDSENRHCADKQCP